MLRERHDTISPAKTGIEFQMQNTLERLFTVEEAAQTLRLHDDTVRLWLRTGRLRGIKVGRSWRIAEQELRAASDLGVSSEGEDTKHTKS
jgi:acetyl-CoA synthetase